MIGRRKAAARLTSRQSEERYSQLIAKLGHSGADPRHGRQRKPLPFKAQGPPASRLLGKAASWQDRRGALSRLGRQRDPEGPWQSHAVAHRPIRHRGALGSGHGPWFVARLTCWLSRGIFRTFARCSPLATSGGCFLLRPRWGSATECFRSAGGQKPGSTWALTDRRQTFRGCSRLRSGPWARAAAAKNTSAGVAGPTI